VKEKPEIKVAIIGCGKIADSHLEQLKRISGCRVVGACDREPLMARQLSEQFEIERCFNDPAELISICRPDVVHITTPPQSHLELGKLCLNSGCHAYIEKPFTLNTREATELLDLVEKTGLKVTVGHDLQFSHAARRMRQLVRDGYLGGSPVHLESYYCYDLSDPRYARALLSDKGHWVRRLPGKLLQNVISHGIARIAEFLAGDSPQVLAHGFIGPVLRRIGETEIVDELRVIINDQDRTTAYFTFSSQMRPSLHELRLFGPKNGLFLDEDQQILIRLRGKRYKSYAEKFIPPVMLAGQYLGNLLRNGRLFLASDFHMDSGKKYLIESFYRSIIENTPMPIPYREILLTSRIMDEIFEQLPPGVPAATKLPLNSSVLATPICSS